MKRDLFLSSNVPVRDVMCKLTVGFANQYNAGSVVQMQAYDSLWTIVDLQDYKTLCKKQIDTLRSCHSKLFQVMIKQC